MRRFVLERKEDVTGISGTGIVAEGCLFDNGKVSLSWLTEVTSVCVYDSLADVEAIHGHQGSTVIVFVDVQECDLQWTIRQSTSS